MLRLLYDYWLIVIGLIDGLLAIWATFHAVLYKRETKTVIGWVGLIWLSPLVGSMLYFFFGVNRIERKGEKILSRIRKSAADAARRATQVKCEFEDAFEGNEQLANIGKEITGFDLLPGNQVMPLLGGEAAFEAMIGAIESAEKTIGLCSYIFDYDAAGKRFIDALVRAQQRGVEVRVLVDHVGARYSKPTAVKMMKQQGLTAATFLPTNVPVMATYANLRNHRKIMIVDAKIGFTGGMNIREGCMHDPKSPAAIQDIHFQFSGPVVEHLQSTFLADWEFATKEELPESDWFDVPPVCGPIWARGIPNGPDGDIDNIRLLMMGAISAAQQRVDIVTPYFLPESALVSSLNVARMRGVHVRVLIPDQVNIRVVKWASMEPVSRILDHGCEVYQSPVPFDHSKMMLVDDTWSLIGSSNWDPRSLRLNFEFNVECFGRELNAALGEIVDAKIGRSTLLTKEMLQQRHPLKKVRDGIARLATPYL